jgi:hypothetical protein
MPQQPPSAALSFFLFFAGVLLGYGVLHSHGLAAGKHITETWARLAVPFRLLVIAGFVSFAYGFGGLLNALLASRHR